VAALDGWYDPAGQPLHEVELSAEVKNPGWQSRQALSADWAENVPAAQGLHSRACRVS
jgi:hypothetical protein